MSRKRYGAGKDVAHTRERVAYDVAVKSHDNPEDFPPYTRGATAPGVREVGFGPQTMSLPIVEEAEPVSDKSFGFYGAVTSTISIVPQVPDKRGDQTR